MPNAHKPKKQAKENGSQEPQELFQLLLKNRERREEREEEEELDEMRRVIQSNNLKTLRSKAVKRLYNSEKVQCKECGHRLENRGALESHLDNHF